MKLVTYNAGAGERLGALLPGELVLDVHLGAQRVGNESPDFDSMLALIKAGLGALDQVRKIIETRPEDCVLPYGEVKLLAPLPRPPRIRDCSLYLEHMEVGLRKIAEKYALQEENPEAALEQLLSSGQYDLSPIFREQIIYYTVDQTEVSGPEDTIRWPSYSNWMDFELEWACIVGNHGQNISRDAASDYIFGYTIFNDWSARDVQLDVMKAHLGPGAGKDFMGGTTIGPCIATPDEFDDPYDLTMLARVNGEEWSRGSSSSMHHKFEDAIVQFSDDKQVIPGELFASGTVMTGSGFDLDRRLQNGDTVELEIDGIGILRNVVTCE